MRPADHETHHQHQHYSNVVILFGLRLLPPKWLYSLMIDWCVVQVLESRIVQRLLSPILSVTRPRRDYNAVL